MVVRAFTLLAALTLVQCGSAPAADRRASPADHDSQAPFAPLPSLPGAGEGAESCREAFESARRQFGAEFEVPALPPVSEHSENGSSSIAVSFGEPSDNGPFCYSATITPTEGADEAWRPIANKAYSGFDERMRRVKSKREASVGTRDRESAARAKRFEELFMTAADRCLGR